MRLLVALLLLLAAPAAAQVRVPCLPSGQVAFAPQPLDELAFTRVPCDLQAGGATPPPVVPLPMPVQEFLLPAARAWSEVAYGGGYYSAVEHGGAGFGASFDGSQWVEDTEAGGNWWSCLAYRGADSGGFWAFIDGSSEAGTLDHPFDPNTWYPVTLRRLGLVTLAARRYVGCAMSTTHLVVIVENQRTVIRAPVTGLWTEFLTAMPTAGPWRRVRWANSKFVATSFSAVLAESADGANWTSRTMPSSTDWTDVAYGNGVWLAVGNSGVHSLARSTDNAATWSGSSPNGFSATRIAYGNGKFVAVGVTSSAFVSTDDGVSWQSQQLPADGPWYITYGPNGFVLISETTRTSLLGQ